MCIYIYIYIYTHISLYICIYICVYTYMYIHMCVYIYIYTHLSLSIYIYIYICICTSFSDKSDLIIAFNGNLNLSEQLICLLVVFKLLFMWIFLPQSCHRAAASSRSSRSLEPFRKLMCFLWMLYYIIHICLFGRLPYTRSPLEDSRLFGPSPWKILATTYEQKDF